MSSVTSCCVEGGGSSITNSVSIAVEKVCVVVGVVEAEVSTPVPEPVSEYSGILESSAGSSRTPKRLHEDITRADAITVAATTLFFT